MRKEIDYSYDGNHMEAEYTTAYAGHNDCICVAGYEMDQDIDYRSIRSYGLATMW